MSRSLRKPPFCAPHVLRLVNRVLASNKLGTIIKIHSRSSMILYKFVGLTFAVYNGKTFVPVKVVDGMVGHKFGEFSPTRRYTGHGADKKAVRR